MFRRCIQILGLVGSMVALPLGAATIFGSVHGIVHDQQHRPISGADVKIKSATSDWSQAAKTDDDGQFTFPTVAIGDYRVTVVQKGFADSEQAVTVISGSAPVLHFSLNVAGAHETVDVSAEPPAANVDSATPITLVSREDIARTPGADRSNSLAIITDFVPGAYFTHDQLHVRGGHQTSWLIDGVEIPNTNIASNLGPQFDPKDIDYLEVQRGSYESDEGDRTYGVFNVVPRTGFERNNQAELIVNAGNFYQTNDQINFGSHNDRFAYYASVNGNRSNLGIQTPVGQILHDAENGYGGFASFIFNPDPQDQLRLVTSLRRDYYQIPNSPGDTVSDGEHEADAFVNFSWVKTFNAKTVLTLSPFYHYNSANYEGGANDFPISTTDERGSRFAGGQVTFAVNLPRNDAQVGFYGFQQHDNQIFSLVFNDLSNPNFTDREPATGTLEAVYIQDKIKVTPWLTLMGGVRPTHFSAGITENATSPRVGAAIQIPRVNVVFRGFYGQFYQAPPLITASGPVLDFVTSNNLGFIPLRGERDEEHQFGVAIPYRGWSLDMDEFRTKVKNFFDHNPVGNSNIFFPITVDGALIRGWELTLRSPRLGRIGHLHLAYSNQIALGEGAVTGGLTSFSPPNGFFTLDHDQRNTLNVGFDANLPWHAFASTNVYYGSGFSNGASGIPGDHLPGHTTFDVSLGKSFGEDFSASISVLNVANRHLLLDNSLTFGGFHFNNPREIYAEMRYRFHYGKSSHK
ncbi:MAG TPA: TonB-dependent receptor [Candidatus Angelobacter sp.]|nr:TonB-dependent receptor [Candidatus Angelobacter sp.]